jgi:hypothetical protein
MDANKKAIWRPTKDKINLGEDYEVQYWSAKFNTTEEKLKKAVKEAGSNAKDVEQLLKKKA